MEGFYHVFDVSGAVVKVYASGIYDALSKAKQKKPAKVKAPNGVLWYPER